MSKKEEQKDNSITNRRTTSSFADASLSDEEQNNYDDHFDYSDRKTKREIKTELSININNFLTNYVSEADNLNIIPLCEYLSFEQIYQYLEMNNV